MRRITMTLGAMLMAATLIAGCALWQEPVTPDVPLSSDAQRMVAAAGAMGTATCFVVTQEGSADDINRARQSSAAARTVLLDAHPNLATVETALKNGLSGDALRYAVLGFSLVRPFVPVDLVITPGTAGHRAVTEFLNGCDAQLAAITAGAARTVNLAFGDDDDDGGGGDGDEDEITRDG